MSKLQPKILKDKCCNECFSEVIRVCCNEPFPSVLHDYHVFCVNPDCVNHEGEGYSYDLPEFVTDN